MLDGRTGPVVAWISHLTRSARRGDKPVIKAPPPHDLAVICSYGQTELLARATLKVAQDHLRASSIPQFWQRVEASYVANQQGLSGSGSLLLALQELCQEVQQQCSQLSTLARQLVSSTPDCPAQLPARLLCLAEQHQRSVSAMLTATAPLSLSDLLQRQYAAKLEELSVAMEAQQGQGRMLDDGDEMEEDTGNQENHDPSMPDARSTPSALDAMGGSWVSEVVALSRSLRLLGLESASEEAYTAAVNRHVHQRLAALAHGCFDAQVLVTAHRYVTSVPMEFLKLVLPREEGCGDELISEWRLRLVYHMYETLGELRIAEMFEIVVDYPDSMPAITDMCQCLHHTNLHHKFVQVLKDAVRGRLLHPGAATGDIIHQYVSTIKALREIDPSGKLLFAVGEPIKQYLRNRSDTIRCIVSMLTEDSGGEGGSLLEELEGAVEPQMGSSTEAEGDALAWQAAEQPSAQAGGEEAGAAPDRAAHDIVTMLIGIYGSKELFINEYRSMLSERLLAKSDYDCDRELRTLELLKLRFGETNMHACEVMLKDFADSKRLNTNIHNIAGNSMVSAAAASASAAAAAAAPALALLSSTISSHLFWPEMPEREMQLPAEVAAAMKVYADRYYMLKTDRKLVWQPTLGVVELALSVGNVSVDFRVSPVHATMLLLMEQQPEMSVGQMATALGIPQAVVRRKALFWVNVGVLAEQRTAGGDIVYSRSQQMEAVQPGAVVVATDLAWEDDGPVAAASAEEQLAAEMAPYENYIIGILTNFKTGLPLERLHNMLRMFVLQPKYENTQEQLHQFLAMLIIKEKVVLDGAIYKRPNAA